MNVLGYDIYLGAGRTSTIAFKIQGPEHSFKMSNMH